MIIAMKSIWAVLAYACQTQELRKLHSLIVPDRDWPKPRHQDSRPGSRRKQRQKKKPRSYKVRTGASMLQ